MQHKYILRSLPLLASILGRKYGVEVRIGGNGAYTNGRVIQLPALPLEGDELLLPLVRAYLDHESAHVRETDFSALKAAKLSLLEKQIWNTLEDRRVEHGLAAVFPGCRQNLHWLIRHLFLNENSADAGKAPGNQAAPSDVDSPAVRILNWLLLSVRAWDVPEIGRERDCLAKEISADFPGLLPRLEALLQTASARCVNTEETITLAREMVAVLRRYVRDVSAQQTEAATGSGTPGQGDVEAVGSDSPLDALRALLDGKVAELPPDCGRMLAEQLRGLCNQENERLHVAVVTRKAASPLSEQQRTETRAATTALRTRLQALLQSMRIVRSRPGFQGALDTRRLHRFALGEPRIFLRRGERQALNTAVHVLLDASGSMQGKALELAGQACFAVASALTAIPGMGVAVTAFPGDCVHDPNGGTHFRTVAPLLKHKEKLHARFSLSAAGSTPMAEALWWALQQMQALSERRKILLLITDGEPDSAEAAIKVVGTATICGCEVYGIGINTMSLRKLLPGRSRSIADMRELAPAMFELLQGAMLGNGRRTAA